MYNLKRKFHSKRRLNSASSSTAGSVSDLDDRVIMLCEDIPHQGRYDSTQSRCDSTQSRYESTQSLRSLRARSSRGSQSEEPESGSESQVIHLSRDRSSYRQACFVEGQPARREYYVQRVVQVYDISVYSVLS